MTGAICIISDILEYRDVEIVKNCNKKPMRNDGFTIFPISLERRNQRC